MARFLEAPEFVRLSGEEAIEALRQLIKDFEKQRGKQLTEKQAKALIKVANELIWYIRTEEHRGLPDRAPKRGHFEFLRRKTPNLRSSMPQ